MKNVSRWPCTPFCLAPWVTWMLGARGNKSLFKFSLALFQGVLLSAVEHPFLCILDLTITRKNGPDTLPAKSQLQNALHSLAVVTTSRSANKTGRHNLLRHDDQMQHAGPRSLQVGSPLHRLYFPRARGVPAPQGRQA